MVHLLTTIRSLYRFSLGLLLILMATATAIVLALLPGPQQDITRPMRVISSFARRVMQVVNIKIHCPDPELLRRHEGIIVSNHISYADVLALLTLTPLRFLAKAEIRAWPMVGLAAQTIGCVFVKRHDRQARAQTRSELAQIEKYPPIVIFPEGTRSAEPGLLPFRYGGFRTAIENGIALLPCALVYDAQSVLKRRPGESMLKTMWRLTSYKGPIRLDIIPLEPVIPDPAQDDAVKLAHLTQANIEAILNEWRNMTNVISNPRE
jgi:1-acyl-sn-glycerol-3-phosphate acyltransferase